MNIADVFKQVVALAKEDALKAALPALSNFLQSVATNPSKINLVVSAAKLQADLLAALPGIEQALLQSIATEVQSAAQLLLQGP